METEIKQIEMKLLKVKEVGFCLNTEAIDSISDFDINKLQIEFGFKADPKLDVNIFTLSILVRYMYEIDAKLERIAELSTANVFEINDLSSFIKCNDEGIQDVSGILPTLVGVAVGTLRGLLLAKTAGTILSDYPLPIVNPTELCEGMNSK